MKKALKIGLLMLLVAPAALLFTGCSSCSCGCNRSGGSTGGNTNHNNNVQPPAIPGNPGGNQGGGNNNQGNHNQGGTGQQLFLQNGTFHVNAVTINGVTMNRMQFDAHLRNQNPGTPTEWGSDVDRQVWWVFERRAIVQGNHVRIETSSFPQTPQGFREWQYRMSSNFTIDQSTREINYTTVDRQGEWLNSARFTQDTPCGLMQFERI